MLYIQLLVQVARQFGRSQEMNGGNLPSDLLAAALIRDRKFCTLLLGLLFLLTSCAGPRFSAEKRASPPDKKPFASSAAIPPTQRPYQIQGKTYYPLSSHQGFTETGIASWYGKEFHGRKTANGETYDMYARTAAHKLLPMSTYLLVKNLENGRETVVRINDRGPFAKARIIDLSYAVAQELDIIGKGTARVKITALGESKAKGKVGKRKENSKPDHTRGDYFIQIGSFTDRGKAEMLKTQIIASNHQADIQLFEKGGRSFYRVQVSAGNGLEQARRLEREFNESGFPGAFVVAR
jgi:rare lipoprotein A